MRALVLLAFASCVPMTSNDPGGSAAEQRDAAVQLPMGPPDAALPFGTCRNKTSIVGSGNHNAGMDCQGVCHDHGFTLSGTLLAGANSSVPVAGATITVKDATGKLVDMVTQQNGNFYSRTVVQYPISVVASSCPDVKQMPGQISLAGGCNRGGCHQVGAEGPIHLP